METLADYHFWFSGFLFFIAVFFSFYLPGFLLVRFVDKSISVRNVLLSLCFGFVLWSMQGYILGYLNLRFITYIYMLCVFLLAISQRKIIHNNWINVIRKIKQNPSVSVIIVIGMIVQTFFMFGSGLVFKDGMYFFGANGVDGIMHLSYINALKESIPPQEPGAYLLTLKNYHYWIDLNIAELSRVWKISELHIFLQWMPPFISIITGIATYMVMYTWTKSKYASLWALFFLYLAGDAAYLLMLPLHHTFGFHMPSIDNGITQFNNMPHAAAKMIFTSSLIPFYYWVKENDKKWGILTVVLFASLIGFKVYFGIFAAVGLVLVVMGKSIRAWFINKKEKRNIISVFSQHSSYFLLSFLFLFIAAVIYFPSNAGAGGLDWYPLEWPKIFLGPNNLDVKEWFLRIQVYESTGNTRNIILLNIFAIIVGLISIQGTRLIGLVPTKKLAKILGWEHLVFFIPGIILFHILGLSTLQRSGSFNVFNFFVVSGVIMSLFSAYLCYELLLKKKWFSRVFVLVILILTIPRAIYEVNTFILSMRNHSHMVIPLDELEALDYVQRNTPKKAIIQSHKNNALDKRTTYVSYYSNRATYLTGIDMISSHGQDIHPFEKEMDMFFTIKDEQSFIKRMKKNNISYLYLQKTPDQQLLFAPDSRNLIELFENKSVIIYKIR